MQTDQQHIEACIETYREGFATLNATQLQSIWDRDYDALYCPIELSQPVRGWAAIQRYYENVTQHLLRVDAMELTDVAIDVLGDTAFAFFGFHFVGELTGKAEPHVVDGRNTIIFRRTTHGWRAIHYHESLQHPF